jgi:hypothetical protein
MATQSDLVHETSTSTGTGSFTTTAVNGKQRFSDAGAFGTGATLNVFDYYISNRDAAEWEHGTGHMSAVGMLVRDSVIAGSNGTSVVSFSAGTKDVTNDVPAAEQLRKTNYLSEMVGHETTALANIGAWSAGDARLTFRTTAAAGWILADDGSIGNASSGATTRANADCAALFAVLYNAITALVVQDSTGATVSRGASAAADFAANRRLVIPKMLGRSIAIAGSGSGLTSRPLGSTAGSETETPTVAKTAAHNHSVSDPTHNHSQNSHGHTISDPGHGHGVSDPGHGHGVSDPGHTHGQETINGSSGSVQTNVNGGGVWWLRGVNDGTRTAASGTGISIAGAGTGISIVGAGTGVSVVANTASNNAASTGISINNNGSGTPLNILDPSTYMNIEIKL